MRTKIAEARAQARVSQQELASALGRSQMWVSLVERGQLQVTPLTEQKVLRATKLLGGYKAAVREGKARILSGVPRLRAARAIVGTAIR